MAIHRAATNSRLNIIKYFIQEAGVDVNVRGWVSKLDCDSECNVLFSFPIIVVFLVISVH